MNEYDKIYMKSGFKCLKENHYSMIELQRDLNKRNTTEFMC